LCWQKRCWTTLELDLKLYRESILTRPEQATHVGITSAQGATKLLKLRSYKTTVLHKLKNLIRKKEYIFVFGFFGLNMMETLIQN
jgi:hypothetical protein